MLLRLSVTLDIYAHALEQDLGVSPSSLMYEVTPPEPTPPTMPSISFVETTEAFVHPFVAILFAFLHASPKPFFECFLLLCEALQQLLQCDALFRCHLAPPWVGAVTNRASLTSPIRRGSTLL